MNRCLTCGLSANILGSLSIRLDLYGVLIYDSLLSRNWRNHRIIIFGFGHWSTYSMSSSVQKCEYSICFIFSTAKTQAEAVIARIAQGEDFAELAKELSSDTFSGENGGDLDYIEPGVMEPSFDEAAFALTTVGDTTELVKTSFIRCLLYIK